MAILTEELKSFIGREVRYPAREELSRASIRYFSLATRDENPLYLDDDYAKAAGYPSLIAQPTLVVETSQYAHGLPDVHGYFAHEWRLPAPNCRLVRAGNDYEFLRPILPTDRISVVWTLEDMTEKAAKRGGTQLFYTSVARFYAENDELVAVNREVHVLQPVEV